MGECGAAAQLQIGQPPVGGSSAGLWQIHQRPISQRLPLAIYIEFILIIYRFQGILLSFSSFRPSNILLYDITNDAGLEVGPRLLLHPQLTHLFL